MKLKDSETFKNLARAFVGECAARTRYAFCEYGFRYNGYEAIATLIDKIAYQEFNHARMLYTKLQDAEIKEIENIDIDAGYPFKQKWDMLENLKFLKEDEEGERESYESFTQIALEEGFDDIANLFDMIRQVEVRHAKIFEELYNQMKDKTLYSRSKEIAWVCPACGYITFDKQAPKVCPLCQTKQGYIELDMPKELYI